MSGYGGDWEYIPRASRERQDGQSNPSATVTPADANTAAFAFANPVHVLDQGADTVASIVNTAKALTPLEWLLVGAAAYAIYRKL